jgi:hypothetical protein
MAVGDQMAVGGSKPVCDAASLEVVFDDIEGVWPSRGVAGHVGRGGAGPHCTCGMVTVC